MDGPGSGMSKNFEALDLAAPTRRLFHNGFGDLHSSVVQSRNNWSGKSIGCPRAVQTACKNRWARRRSDGPSGA
eukprot:196697-Alexandrium_andersonii.AAC.1